MEGDKTGRIKNIVSLLLIKKFLKNLFGKSKKLNYKVKRNLIQHLIFRVFDIIKKDETLHYTKNHLFVDGMLILEITLKK